MKMMKLMNYVLGLGLGKRHQGTHKIIEVKERTNRHGLGYVPTPKDVAEDRKAGRGNHSVVDKRGPYTTSNLCPYSFDITRYFIKKIHDLNEDIEKKAGIINARQGWSATMDKWEKLEQNLEKFRGLEPNPVRRSFLDALTLSGPTTTTIHNEFWFGETPALVEELEKLSVITPATNKRDDPCLS